MKIPHDEIRFTYSRSPGPGGQNVNKVNTKATLRWNVDESSLPKTIRRNISSLFPNRVTASGELIISSWKHRSQKENKSACLEKFQKLLREAAKPRPRRVPTKPSKTAKERRLEGKKQLSRKKNERKKGVWENELKN